MSDFEKWRTQRDARRSAASRRSSGPTAAEQALIRHLGVEIYRERHQAEHAPDEPGRTDGGRPDESGTESPTDRSSDR